MAFLPKREDQPNGRTLANLLNLLGDELWMDRVEARYRSYINQFHERSVIATKYPMMTPKEKNLARKKRKKLSLL